MAAIGNDRPRELHWYHAGPMLFGDLGTSRLYVLGLAFYFTRHASLFHILFVNILLLLVGTRGFSRAMWSAQSRNACPDTWNWSSVCSLQHCP